jgi:hypothetical protein
VKTKVQPLAWVRSPAKRKFAFSELKRMSELGTPVKQVEHYYKTFLGTRFKDCGSPYQLLFFCWMFHIFNKSKGCFAHWDEQNNLLVVGINKKCSDGIVYCFQLNIHLEDEFVCLDFDEIFRGKSSGHFYADIGVTVRECRPQTRKNGKKARTTSIRDKESLRKNAVSICAVEIDGRYHNLSNQYEAARQDVEIDCFNTLYRVSSEQIETLKEKTALSVCNKIRGKLNKSYYEHFKNVEGKRWL